VPSLTGLYPNAGWYERETWDCYGVMFAGNPDMRRILTELAKPGRDPRPSFETARFKVGVESLSDLQPGMELEGTVTNVAQFGAFVDLGGVEGMVHVSELGWSRVANPADVLSMGATVRVRILRIEDSVTKDGRPSKRIKLSMKAATNDPWLEAIAAFSIGSTYSGTVAKLEKFGAFVEIAPGVDGLVHISEMAVGRRISHPSEVVAVGDLKVAADVPGEGKLLEEAAHAQGVLALIGVDLAVAAIEVGGSQYPWGAMAGPRQIDHVEIVAANHPVGVGPDEGLAR
jgi:transcriptional accessory protein Tex/SPT6